MTSRDSLDSQNSQRRWLANPGILMRQERVWTSRQKWLEEHGYMLRSRYHPDWTPSWGNKWYSNYEDGQVNRVSNPYSILLLSLVH